MQDTIPHAYFKLLQDKLKSDKSKIQEGSKQSATYIKEFLDNRTAYVIENFNADYFITESDITTYLQRLLKKIYQANPQLSQETTVFPFRSSAVNALSFGEGTLAFTVGLLARMETEEQIMFVLCHELAHYHSKHSEIKMSQLANLYSSKEFKKEIKSINRSEYGQYSRLSKLANSLELSVTKHGREKEFEADSIALTYYLNTTSDHHSPIRTLEILDSADVAYFSNNLNLKSIFNFSEYSFKDSWSVYAPSYEWHKDSFYDEDADSLRTHPGCKRRIETIKRQLLKHTKLNEQNKNSSTTTSNVFQHAGLFESIESEYYFKRYGAALFDALMLQEIYPDNVYLQAMVGKCLFQLYNHQENHELGKVLAQPDPRFAENYDRFLTFVHSLRLKELASLTYFYMASKKTVCEDDEEFLYAYWFITKINTGTENPDGIKAQYLRKFPTGKHINDFK